MTCLISYIIDYVQFIILHFSAKFMVVFIVSLIFWCCYVRARLRQVACK